MHTASAGPPAGFGPHAGAYRPPAIGRNGVVAAAHGLAATAGLRALYDGGTAVDAAIAVGATLGVVEPFMSGIGGGGGFMLIYEAETGTVHALDYLGPAPAVASAAAFSSIDEIDTDVRSATVPSVLAGWLAAHERFGRLDRARLFQSAIDLADQPMGGRRVPRLRATPAAASRLGGCPASRWRAAAHRLDCGSA
jgi:gamma-glutamyltranspeptidase